MVASLASSVASVDEYSVKAAFIYKVALFVTWPEAARVETFGVCVCGDDPFGATLDRTMERLTVDHRPVVVRRLPDARAATAATCAVVWVGARRSGLLRDELAILQDQPFLTMGDAEDFADTGGVVELMVYGGRVRFEVNRSAAKRARLEISSQLLKLAHRVRE